MLCSGPLEMQIAQGPAFSVVVRVAFCAFCPMNVHPEFAQSLPGLSNSKEEYGLSNDI
jgi:hypothetical protein